MTQALVFFDLDLTLLNDDKQIDPANLAALVALQANDCLPVINTGRNLWELQDLLAATKTDTAVGANGADILLHGKHFSQSPIGLPQLERLTQMATQDQLPLVYYNHQGLAATEINAAIEANYAMIYQPMPPVSPDFYRQEPVVMALLFAPNNEDGAAIQAKYQAAFPELTFYRNGPHALDVINKGMDKGFGVRLLAGQPEFKGAKTFAFGDGNNDIAMFDVVDTAVAMGNALPNVLEHADYQTDDYKHEGIPNALRHFGLI